MPDKGGTPMYLSGVSRARLKEAENARKNRAEIAKALSWAQVTRRDLIKMGLFTAGGLLLWKHGLNPFVRSAYADSSIPTGLPRSPLFGVQAFTQPMPRFDVLPRNPEPGFLNPAPTAQANTTQQLLNPALEGVRPGDTGPIEGRPPGPIWAHQGFNVFPPKIAVKVTQEGAKVNTVYNPGVPSSLNSGINAAAPFPPRFHPNLPDRGSSPSPGNQASVCASQIMPPRVRKEVNPSSDCREPAPSDVCAWRIHGRAVRRLGIELEREGGSALTSRTSMLKRMFSLSAAVGLIAFCATAFAAPVPGGTLDPTTIPQYVDPLPIPQVMPKQGTIGTTIDNYEIAARQIQQQVLSTGLPQTTVWGYGAPASPSSFSYPA